MNRKYCPSKKVNIGKIVRIREWQFDEPALIASHPYYEFLIADSNSVYAFYTMPLCETREKFKKVREEYGIDLDEVIMRGRFGLSLGEGLINGGFTPARMSQLKTLHIFPTATLLSDEDTKRLLDRIQPLVFNEYKKVHPQLTSSSRNDFY